jgi:hypothetical protein
MGTKEGVAFNAAVEKDPTLNAVLGSKEFIDAFEKHYEQKIDSIVANATPGDGGLVVDEGKSYLRIGGRTYVVETPAISLDYETEDQSFDYDYGSISSTEEVSANSLTGMDFATGEELLANSKVRLATSEEEKRLVSVSRDDNADGVGMPNQIKGVDLYVNYKDTKEFRQSNRVVKAYKGKTFRDSPSGRRAKQAYEEAVRYLDSAKKNHED